MGDTCSLLKGKTIHRSSEQHYQVFTAAVTARIAKLLISSLANLTRKHSKAITCARITRHPAGKSLMLW
jgi:hypothetical protein